MTKMTYVDALNIALATVADETAVERLTALRDTLVKRASKPRKPSKADLVKAEADTQNIARIRDILRTVTGATCKEIANELGDLSVPKVAALLRKMGAVKTDDRTPLYSLPDDEEGTRGLDIDALSDEMSIPDEVEA